MRKLIKSTIIFVAVIAASSISVEAHVGTGRAHDGSRGRKSCHEWDDPSYQMSYKGTKQPCMHTRYERRSTKPKDCCHLHDGNSSRTEWTTTTECGAICIKRGNRYPVKP